MRWVTIIPIVISLISLIVSIFAHVLNIDTMKTKRVNRGNKTKIIKRVIDSELGDRIVKYGELSKVHTRKKISINKLDFSNCVIIDPDSETQINMIFNDSEDKNHEYPIDCFTIKSLENEH